MEEVTANAVERARELELEMQLEDVTELLQSRDKTFEESLFMDEQRMQFLEMESTSSEDAMKTVEMTTKDLRILHKIS